MVVSKSRSSASLTVIAPVPASMANGRLPSLSPSVLPAVIGPGEALVVAGRGDGDDRGAVGGGLGEVGRGVRDGRGDVGDRDGDDLGVGGRAVGGLDREVVAGGRLEVEVVRVVDGDRARARVDGERQVAVAVPVGVAGGDGPAGMRPSSSPVVETVTTAALSAAVSARLAEVSATVGATSVIVMVMSSVSGVVPSVALTVSV